MKKIKKFLDYDTTHSDTIVTYQASDVILAVHSDASYLSETNTRRIAGVHLFMPSYSSEPPNNGSILNVAHILKQSYPQQQNSNSEPYT